jgi:tetratricopeptide (TPR) repeat protein
MTRNLAILAWLLPVAGIGYYHFSKGASGVLMEKADRLQRQAVAREKAGAWGEAAKLYDEAAAIIPANKHKLEKAGVVGRAARAKMRDGEIELALLDLKSALAELPPGPKSDPLERDLRYSLAETEYYAAWILRLENQPRAKWFPHATCARQNLRFLAEDPGLPAAERTGHARDMEAVIRLTRLDIEELKKLPLPEQAQPGSKKMSGGKKKGEGEEEGEGPPQDGPPKKGPPQKGAGKGERPPGVGS